tara:strand:+ start:184 stop:1746 length:1563 start_codon:yes stop_codon:yes gene_type:complete
MPTKQDIFDFISAENDNIKRETLASPTPLSPPVIIPGSTRKKVLDKLENIPNEEKKSYNFFVFGKAAQHNFIQVAAPDDSVKRIDGDLTPIDGIAFVNTGDKTTRAFFDFDCPVEEGKNVEEKAASLEKWILRSFWTAVKKFCKVPSSHGKKVVVSTKHRKNKVSFHLISTDIVAEDCRVWAYKMKDFWTAHADLLKESWAFMGSKICANKNANGVEDGAPRGRADGSPIHQWVEHGRTTHHVYTLSSKSKIVKEPCTPWDAHPQRVFDTSQSLFFVTAKKTRYGTNVRKRTREQDHEKRMKKFVSDHNSEGSSNDGEQRRAWDAYPKHSRMIKLAFEEVSRRTECPTADMSLKPVGSNFIVNYRATEAAKQCPLVEGHKHSKNHAKFMICLSPHFVLLGGCHSTNHQASVPKWKTLLEYKMAPFPPPKTPSAVVDIGEENSKAHMICVRVPSTSEFCVRFTSGNHSVDITNMTEDHDPYSIRINGKIPILAKPSCINVPEFINGPNARNLVKKCYYLFA